MRKALFIAYDFQPCFGLGSSIRSVKFVEQLPRWGWRATVLALDTPEAREQGELFNDVWRIPSLTPFSRPYQITPYGWAVTVWRRARYMLEQENFDLIYVSCPPFPQALGCAALKRKFKCPLVVDFRDAWSLDPYREGSRLKKFIYRRVFPGLERKMLDVTDRLILNTPSALKAYQALYPRHAARMVLIPNGYDERDFSNPLQLNGTSDRMRLLYCGRFGIGGRDARPIFAALKQLLDEGLRISLSLVGVQPSSVGEAVTAMGLEGHVQLEAQVPHKQAISRMHDCDVLMLYQESSNAEIQPVAGKTYEYLRTGQPVLSIAPPGDNQELIGCYAQRCEQVTEISVESIAQALRRLYTDWQAGRLAIQSELSPEYAGHYERNVLARNLAGLFDELVAGEKPP